MHGFIMTETRQSHASWDAEVASSVEADSCPRVLDYIMVQLIAARR